MINIIFKLISLLIFSRANFDDDSPITSDLMGFREGIVGNESFVYYYLHHTGNIIISLTSSQGDADMYVSESKAMPSFYPDAYDFHSATCGKDIIEISPNVKSPLAIGVYGHSAYELSEFTLEIYKNPEATTKVFAVIVDEL